MYLCDVHTKLLVPLFLIFFSQLVRSAEGQKQEITVKSSDINFTTLGYERERRGSLLKRADDENPEDDQAPSASGREPTDDLAPAVPENPGDKPDDIWSEYAPGGEHAQQQNKDYLPLLENPEVFARRFLETPYSTEKYSMYGPVPRARRANISIKKKWLWGVHQRSRRPETGRVMLGDLPWDILISPAFTKLLWIRINYVMHPESFHETCMMPWPEYGERALRRRRPRRSDEQIDQDSQNNWNTLMAQVGQEIKDTLNDASLNAFEEDPYVGWCYKWMMLRSYADPLDGRWGHQYRGDENKNWHKTQPWHEKYRDEPPTALEDLRDRIDIDDFAFDARRQFAFFPWEVMTFHDATETLKLIPKLRRKWIAVNEKLAGIISTVRPKAGDFDPEWPAKLAESFRVNTITDRWAEVGLDWITRHRTETFWGKESDIEGAYERRLRPERRRKAAEDLINSARQPLAPAHRSDQGTSNA
ncbi:MAG: hypothetical protein M1831_005496 [Alyxoria varia]|nr:MAG: hypothetical protein M1831_005496 [Alyxoria varia]